MKHFKKYRYGFAFESRLFAFSFRFLVPQKIMVDIGIEKMTRIEYKPNWREDGYDTYTSYGLSIRVIPFIFGISIYIAPFYRKLKPRT